MNTFLLFIILLLSFSILILAFFALSSCLGDEIRAAWSGRRNSRTIPTTFGLQYARMMGQSSGDAAGWEQIEMQDIIEGADEGEERY